MKESNYFAFISYKSEDVEWAKWLQHELEHYRLPSMSNSGTDLPKELRPIFRDIDELSAGNLSEQIFSALSESVNLIVVCSPAAAKSPWVSKEVEAFIKMGKTSCIFPFIVEGSSPSEYFPPALQKLPEKDERLGGDVTKCGRDVAFIKIVAGMLGLGFDTLWNRYEKEKAEEERKQREQRDNLLRSQSLFLAEKSLSLSKEGNPNKGTLYALDALPKNILEPERPIIQEAIDALYKSVYFESKKLHRETGFTNYKSPITRVVFGGDNSNCLISCSGNDILIWNIFTGELIKELKGHTGKVTDIVYVGSGDSMRIVSGAEDENLRIWDFQSDSCIKTIKNHGTWVKSITTNEDVIVVAFVDWTIGVYNWNGDVLSHEIEKKHKGTIMSIDCNGKYVVTGSFDKTIAIWDFNQKIIGECEICLKPELKRENDYITVVKINSNYLLAGTTDGTVYVWDVVSWKMVGSIKDTDDHESVTALFIYNKIVITGYKNGVVKLWNIKGKCINSIKAGEGSINSISFNGEYLAVGSDDGFIYLYNVQCARYMSFGRNKKGYDDMLWLRGHEEEMANHFC